MESSPTYPWYQTLPAGDTSLEQGDFIPNCPIILPPQELYEGAEVDLIVEQYDVILLTQSCDLENNKVSRVLVCPFVDLHQYFTEQPDITSKKGMNSAFKKLKDGILPGLHLLDTPPGLTAPIVVDFRHIYGVPKGFLHTHAASLTDRIRLLPPYKEHLSQAFARYFMRVGLPSGISPHSF